MPETASWCSRSPMLRQAVRRSSCTSMSATRACTAWSTPMSRRKRYVRYADWQQFGPLRLPKVRYEGVVGEAPVRVVLDEVRFVTADAELFAGNPVAALPRTL